MFRTAPWKSLAGSCPVPVALMAFAVLPVAAQEVGSVVSETGIATPSQTFRLKGEIKVHGRDARLVQRTPPGLVLRTVLPETSAELSNVAVIGEGDFTPHISAKLQINFQDLYTRNPTSSGDRVLLREAWIRFGKKYEALAATAGTTVYLQVGRAPHFSKQLVRRLESYGLWGTALSRLEDLGVEAGGSFGNIYWRASLTNGNPVFIRDPNALSGENGITGPSAFGSGFPILYDASAGEVNLRSSYQVGGGLGFRVVVADGNGVDVLGWYFERTLAERVAIRGSSLPADLALLRGTNGISLPIQGREKVDYGANLAARFGGFQLFGQYARQEIADLLRHGYEVEATFRIPLNGLFASGDSPVINWIAPAVRVSAIENDFVVPPGFFAPTLGWDWRKYDFGLRVGIIRGLDVTAEYSRHDAVLLNGAIVHPDEGLLTFRLGF